MIDRMAVCCAGKAAVEGQAPYTGRASEKSAAAPFSGVGWDAVGGNVAAMQQLREMVLLPLLYPEVFEQMGVCAPR